MDALTAAELLCVRWQTKLDRALDRVSRFMHWYSQTQGQLADHMSRTQRLHRQLEEVLGDASAARALSLSVAGRGATGPPTGMPEHRDNGEHPSLTLSASAIQLRSAASLVSEPQAFDASHARGAHLPRASATAHAAPGATVLSTRSFGPHHSQSAHDQSRVRFTTPAPRSSRMPTPSPTPGSQSEMDDLRRLFKQAAAAGKASASAAAAGRVNGTPPVAASSNITRADARARPAQVPPLRVSAVAATPATEAPVGARRSNSRAVRAPAHCTQRQRSHQPTAVPSTIRRATAAPKPHSGARSLAAAAAAASGVRQTGSSGARATQAAATRDNAAHAPRVAKSSRRRGGAAVASGASHPHKRDREPRAPRRGGNARP